MCAFAACMNVLFGNDSCISWKSNHHFFKGWFTNHYFFIVRVYHHPKGTRIFKMVDDFQGIDLMIAIVVKSKPPSCQQHPNEGGVKIMDSFADRRIDPGAAENFRGFHGGETNSKSP